MEPSSSKEAASESFLPDGVIEALASSLFGSDVLSARNVNKRWREVLTPLVRVAIVSPRHWAEQPRAKSEKLVRTFLGLETLQVVIDANRHPRTLDQQLLRDSLEPFAEAKSLQAMQLVCRTTILPNEGYPVDHFDAYVERWTQLEQRVTNMLKVVMPVLGSKLTSLDLNVQCNMLHGLQPAVSVLTGLQKLRYTLSDHYTISVEDCGVLKELRGLQGLYLRSWLPHPFSDPLQGALSVLTQLTSLELEAVSIPPDDSRIQEPSFLSTLTGLQVLRVKGLGLERTQWLTCLTALRELTLTMTSNIGAGPAWSDLAALTAVTSLNVNAWANVAPTAEASAIQRVQSFEGLKRCHMLNLRSLGVKLQSPRDLPFVAELFNLEDLILAFDPTPPEPRQVSAYTSCLASLSALKSLRRLDVYDTGGALRLTQGAMESFAQWWPHLSDLYYEGIISIQAFSNFNFPKLDHLDLINTAQAPFKVSFAHLPGRLQFMGLQNAVVVYDATKAVPLHTQLQSLSLMRGITWADPAGSEIGAWLGMCSRLTSLRLEYSMYQWGDGTRGTATTPLAALAACAVLQFLDVMFVDSNEASEGLLDGRLVADIAALPKVEEIEVWTRRAADWHEDTSFLPLTACARLRSLKMEVLPHDKCIVVRDIVSAALPNCRLRLVADRIGELLR